MRRTLPPLAAAGLGLAVAWPVRTVPYQSLAERLDQEVDGERHAFQWRLGDVSYRQTGSGAPVVLVHGINAAASSWEMRRNVGPLGADFSVYAPDLLGFGLSDRPSLRYTARTYVDLLADFLREVVGGPAHVVASSLSGAHAVQVAREQPDLVRSLVLICPTGIEQLHGPPGPAQRAADALLGTPLLGDKLFSWLVSRPSVRYFLKSMAYHDPSLVTSQMIEIQHSLGRRPGARWAPEAFTGGRFNLDIAESFAELRQPVLLVWGKQAKTTPLADAPAFLERNPRAILRVLDGAALLPHDEQAEAFNELIRTWIKEHA